MGLPNGEKTGATFLSSYFVRENWKVVWSVLVGAGLCCVWLFWESGRRGMRECILGRQYPCVCVRAYDNTPYLVTGKTRSSRSRKLGAHFTGFVMTG